MVRNAPLVRGATTPTESTSSRRPNNLSQSPQAALSRAQCKPRNNLRKTKRSSRELSWPTKKSMVDLIGSSSSCSATPRGDPKVRLKTKISLKLWLRPPLKLSCKVRNFPVTDLDRQCLSRNKSFFVLALSQWAPVPALVRARMKRATTRQETHPEQPQRAKRGHHGLKLMAQISSTTSPPEFLHPSR